MKHFVLFLISLTVFVTTAYSSELDSTSFSLPQILSPNAAGLGRYGQVPVGYFTGQPNIRIPLTELKAKGYTLPVYLSYNAGGNKPEEHPGWVGQGWTLHAGGCINRKINGLKDEISKYEYYNVYWHGGDKEHGYFNNMGALDVLDLTNQENLRQIALKELSNNNIPFREGFDLEPDEFQVNLEGLHASFYFHGDKETKIVSQEGKTFVVNYHIHEEPYGSEWLTLYEGRFSQIRAATYDYIDGFTLTADDGTIYRFGYDEKAIEYSVTHYEPIPNALLNNHEGLRGLAIANTWMLTSVCLPNGEKIIFTYNRAGTPIVRDDCHEMFMFSCDQNLIFLGPDEGRARFDSRTAWHQENNRLFPDVNPYYRVNVHYCFLRPSYLHSIASTIAKDTVKFHNVPTMELQYPIDETEMLARVNRQHYTDEMRNQNYFVQLSQIDHRHEKLFFVYSYSDSTRLKLLSILLTDKGYTDREYNMRYNSTPLPGYNSRCSDLWGYNLGTPYSPREETIMQERSSVNPEALQAEMLMEIEYPTGGRTIFEYEPHSYSRVMQQFPFQLINRNGYAGGLRIKRIVDIGVDNSSVSKRYIYEKDNGLSSGILSGDPLCVGTWLFQNWDGLLIRDSIFTERPFNQLSSTNGNHVTYSVVKELCSDGSLTEYRYTNHDTPGCADEAPSAEWYLENNQFPFKDFSSKAINRGLLYLVQSFDRDGDCVRKEELSYSLDTLAFINRVSRRIMHSSYFVRVSYCKIFTHFPAMKRRIVTTYPDGGGVPKVEVSEYEYNDHRQLVKEVRRDSVCREEVRTTYSGDIRPYGVYAQMQAAGIFDRPVEQTVLRGGAVVSSKLTTYRQSDSLFVPDRMYESRLDTPCPAGSWHPYDGAFQDWQRDVYGSPKLSFDSYDSKGNILSATGEGGARYRYFWEPSGMHPEASFTGMLMPPLHTSQVEDIAGQDHTFDGQLTEYSFVFDAERTGPFSSHISFLPHRGYNLSGTMDGDTVFNYVCPNPEAILPTTTLYEGTVSAGHHTFKITYSPDQNSPTLPGGTSLFLPALSGTAWIDYPVYSEVTTADDVDAWFHGFEGDGNRTLGFNSKKSWAGQKTITHLITAGIPYTIDWMELRGGQWQYRSEPFSGSRTIGSGATAIDNVRVYPSDAAATNWSWTPTGELRSVTDGRGITESYEYDGMGRLLTVRDGDRKRKASYDYHYATSMLGSPGNYVWAKQYTHPAVSDTTSARETVKYYDGLGRPWQTLSVNAGADGVHLCERTDYDASGRPFRTWLPFRTSSLAPQTGVPSEPLYSDAEPYSLIEYATDPLERPRAEYGPGESWHLNGKAVRHGYLTNGGGPLLRCDSLSVRWIGDTTYVISRAGSRMEGTLAVKSVQDEDGLAVLTFSDLYGRVLLERRHPVSGDDLDTYYVYDDMGRLAAVVPPALSQQNTINNADMDKFAYLYRYDGRGNCTAKKLPGCGWTYMVYDARGALVLSQDAVQRREGRWTLTLTDGQGRPCITGTCTAAPDVFGSTFGHSSAYARRTGEGGTYYGYTLYMIDPQDFILDQANLWSAYGLTGSYDRVLGPVSGDRLLHTTHAYDAKGREVQTVRETHLGGTETEQFTYSFTDEVLSRTVIHADASGQTMTEQYGYTYDTWGRLLTTSHRVGNGATVCLHANAYDGLGRLASDGRNGASPLLTSFQQNVRSWLTGITCGGIFQETLSYESPSFGGVPQWGGRISSANWRFGTDVATRRYVYGYDGHGRLVSAGYYYGVAGGDYDTSYSYDANGNITGMSRTSRVELPGLLPSKINKITNYTLSGNQMTDRTTYEMYGRPGTSPRLMSGKGELEPTFPGDAVFLPPTAVAYDRCGRMVRDLDRDILSVEYNRLGLPSRVQYAAADANSSPGAYGVQYAADGRKLRAGRLVPALIEIEPALSLNAVPMAMAAPGLAERAEEFECPTDYVGNLVYRSGVLDKILVDGGFISAADMAYHFFVADHLGNTRVVANAAGLVEQNYHYYPDGQSIDDWTQIEFDNPYKWSGKEWDEGLGAYDFGARLFAPADSRWTTPDPLSEKYYHISPYAYCAGDPVNLVDPDGRKIKVKGNSAFRNKVYAAVDHLSLNGIDEGFLVLSNSPKTYTIEPGRINSYNPKTRTVFWSPDYMKYDEERRIVRSPTVSLQHEVGHATNHDKDEKKFYEDSKTPDVQYGNIEERNVIEGIEQETARALGEISETEVTRQSHGGSLGPNVSNLSPENQSKLAAFLNYKLDRIYNEPYDIARTYLY